MVIYLDTSALIKLYIEEHGRELVTGAVASADIVVTSTAAYAEARAGLSRRYREGDFTSPLYRKAVSDLGDDWETYGRLPVREDVTMRAGNLAERHALRGFDAIHLASALLLAEQLEDLQLLAFDRRLIHAAQEAGLTTYSSVE
jgi:predicted nucleic acid-binding protein